MENPPSIEDRAIQITCITLHSAGNCMLLPALPQQGSAAMGYRHVLKEWPESQDILQECTKHHMSWTLVRLKQCTVQIHNKACWFWALKQLKWKREQNRVTLGITKVKVYQVHFIFSANLKVPSCPTKSHPNLRKISSPKPALTTCDFLPSSSLTAFMDEGPRVEEARRATIRSCHLLKVMQGEKNGIYKFRTRDSHPLF